MNRVDSEEKDFGYIIDYQDLFGAVKSAIEDYTMGHLMAMMTTISKAFFRIVLPKAEKP